MMPPLAVHCGALDLEAHEPSWLANYRSALASSGEDRVGAALALASQVGSVAAPPGEGQTVATWETLARVAACDLVTARVLEPHLDALAILAQAPQQPWIVQARADSARTWGVFAAESGSDRLEATDLGDGAVLEGRKPWCSLAGRLSHALVTAWNSDSTRRLYLVDLRDAGVQVDSDEGWVARGLAEVTSTSVTFSQVPAKPVGPAGWYLSRPGFWWGAIGVAACWYGGAAGVAGRLMPGPGRAADQIALMHLGGADADLHAARVALCAAAEQVDAGQATGSQGQLLALRVRAVVRAAAESVMQRTAHATGPGPLAMEDQHARRVADLELYLRQEHAERDAARLGTLLSGVDA